MDEKNYDFEFVLKLTELWDDFINEWPADQMNQPTMLDFFSWVSDLAGKMADELGEEIDENLPPTSISFAEDPTPGS